jgi:hypothetical protein
MCSVIRFPMQWLSAQAAYQATGGLSLPDELPLSLSRVPVTEVATFREVPARLVLSAARVSLETMIIRWGRFVS